MSCMEHRCTKCDWFALDNKSHKVCPVCGEKVLSYFDEEGDHESPNGDDYNDIDLE